MPSGQQPGHLEGKAGKLLHEGIAVYAYPRRRAVVHECPQHLHSAFLRRPRQMHQALHVETSRAWLADAPADALADRTQPQRRSGPIVLLRPLQVAVGRGHVERLPSSVDVVGALEAAHPERAQRVAGAAAIPTHLRSHRGAPAGSPALRVHGQCWAGHVVKTRPPMPAGLPAASALAGRSRTSP